MGGLWYVERNSNKIIDRFRLIDDDSDGGFIKDIWTDMPFR